MFISTLTKALSPKRVAMLALVAAGAMMASAQTFVADGVIWKASGNKVTAQKAGTKVTTGEAGPTVYAGDIVINAQIEYGGKSYIVSSIGSVFKDSEITSITIADGVATISRGCFSGCKNLKTAKFPADLTTFNGNMFENCTALEEFEIPGSAKEIASNQFKNCSSLRKLVIADGATALELSAGAFTVDEGVTIPLEEVVINRAIGNKYTAMDTKPFRGAKALKKVTLGGSCVNLPASYFENSTLETVVFESAFTTLNTNVFAATNISEITYPEGVTSIPASLMQNCKQLKKVTLGSAVESIGDMAFYNSTVSEIILPASLKSIGQMAFSGAKIAGDLVLPEAVKTIGVQAYANNGTLASVSLPAATTRIGDGAFLGCTSIAKFSVAAENENYSTDADGKYIQSKDGETIICYAPKAAGTEFTGNFKTVAPYAFYKSSLESITLPACNSLGDYALSETPITKLEVKGLVGRYVAKDCKSLKELTIGSPEVPFGIASGCAALEKVNFTKSTVVVKQDAFAGCTSLKSLDLGSILAILEADCFKGSGIETLIVGSTFPPAMAEGVFTAESSNITAKVPVDLVEDYKAADGWKYLNIAGDANLVAGGADMGMPAGLYYAGEDGMLHVAYADGNDDTYDVGGVPHTFQLIEFQNRIYGASAGKKFVYSATGSVDGDGKLFYISKIGGEVFQATVLDNAGNNAYKDPFGLYIYGEDLYVNDRNVCVRKVPASAIALPQSYPSWMENNWLGYYGMNWSYGCIKSGFAITTEPNKNVPLYWVGMKFNGNGIYRFVESDIVVPHKDENGKDVNPKLPEYSPMLAAMSPLFTTFNIDEANGHLYIYIEKTAGDENTMTRGGLYRIDLAKLYENPDPANLSALDPVLIDGSPVKYEGSGVTEHVGITQLAFDAKHEYLYWCYRAPSPEEAAANEASTFAEMGESGKYWWADKYDENNPLHHSGIKRIKLGEAKPTVEMVVKDVNGYGIVPVNYEGSTKPGSGVATVVVNGAKLVSVANNVVAAAEDVEVAVYDLNGVMVGAAVLAAGQEYNIDNLAAGAYVINAVAANGDAQAVKYIKK